MNQNLALKVFTYKDGSLYWASPTNPKRTPVGSKAGTVSKRGYIHVQYDRKIYKGHQLVYLMFHGVTPDGIDHINGVTWDNRIENLRPATISENQKNARKRVDNTSGEKNVSWHSRRKKWTVQLCFHGKIRHFGAYDDIELASLVAHEARSKFHKEFVNHG